MELRLQFGAEPTPWLLGLGWLLTYLAHGAVWAAAVALLARSRRVSAAIRNWCWKLALLGPLTTASVATGSSAIPSFLARSFDRAVAVGAPAGVSRSIPRGGPHLATVVGLRHGRALAWLGLLAGAGGLLRFAGCSWALHRKLARRRPLTDARIVARVDVLRARMALGRVRLSQCEALTSPLVIGVREVCLPHHLSSFLPEAELDAVLAHELAHIERQDGLWFPLVGALQSALWLQPLNHLVSSCFRDSAELACDDRAADLIADPTALARALLHVAENACLARQLSLLPMIGANRSSLLRRVRRLTATADRYPGRPAYAKIPVKVLVLVMGLTTVGVRVAGAESEPAQQLLNAREAASAAPLDAGGPSFLPSAAEQSAQMAELANRAQQLTLALEIAQRRPASRVHGTPAEVSVLELSQELRHVRAQQILLEQRFVALAATLEHL